MIPPILRAVASLMLLVLCVQAEEVAPSFSPDLRELWVPADQLKGVLAKNPKAIVLSKEQYESLLRNAAPKIVPEPPRRATLNSAKYSGRAEGKTLRMTGELLIEVLSDEWTQVALPTQGVRFGTIEVDGEAALLGATPETGTLLVRGRGQHKLTASFTAQITSKSGRGSFNLGLPPAAAALFEVELPGRVRVQSAAPARIEKRGESTWVSIVPSSSSVALQWQTLSDGGALGFEQKNSTNYWVDAEAVRARFDVDLLAILGNLPAEFLMSIPKGAQVLEVVGAEISDWSVANERIRVQMPTRDRLQVRFRVNLEMPSLAGAPAATIALPVLKVDGALPMHGIFSIDTDRAGVAIRSIVTDSSTVQTSSGASGVSAELAAFSFAGGLQSPRISVVKVEPRLNADLDTLIEFKPEAIFLERTLTLKETQGAFFSTKLKLPAGEELLSVTNADGSEPDWRDENGSVQLRWSERSATPRVFKIASRAEPKEWAALEGTTYPVGDLQIEGVGKITGYIALKADPAFRLEAQPSETLEQRDGRTTPVRGDYAWFRRNDFTLAVKVSKLPGEALAALTGYALPLEGMLDVHAQLAFSFLRSGVRAVRIQVPEPIAPAFHFEGPQIAERNLVGDIWTIVFQKELTGDYALSVTVQVPIPKEGADTFKVGVPKIEPLDVKRVSGVWAVEANTETEISFTVKGMNELDSLLAPSLPGYSPRHRVIGVFNYLGGEHSLSLSGVRHGQAETLTSIVDELSLETVVSTSGIERNQAFIQLRSAGAQFLDVTLPPGSKLWSLEVNGELVKPVGDKAGLVRIQLPAQADARAALMLLYETPKPAWQSRGGYDVVAPRLAKSIPVLKSSWKVYLPDGFQYTGLESNLRPPAAPPEPLLVRQLFNANPLSVFLRARKRIQSTRMLEDLRVIDAAVEQYSMETSGVMPPPSPALMEALKATTSKLDLQSEAADNSRQDLLEQAWEKKLSSIIVPRIVLREATLQEATEFLTKKSIELDPSHEGVKFVNSADLPPSGPISFELTNLPLRTALDYVTQIAGVKYSIVGDAAIKIVPMGSPNDSLVTREIMVGPNFIKGQDAMAFLTMQGIPFPPGAAATYLPASSRLIVRNTQENLDMVDLLLPAGGIDHSVASPQGVAGLLPIKMELSRAGQPVVFEGLYDAQTVAFQYEDWWGRARRLWFWLIGGALLFLGIGRHSWWRSAWAVLILSFIPLCISQSATPICNALLGGWLAALLLERIARRLVFTTTKKEVVA